jgi:hypothetical protein
MPPALAVTQTRSEFQTTIVARTGVLHDLWHFQELRGLCFVKVRQARDKIAGLFAFTGIRRPRCHTGRVVVLRML